MTYPRARHSTPRADSGGAKPLALFDDCLIGEDMKEATIEEMTLDEIDLASGGRGISAVEGAGLIFALGGFALGSPIVVGVALGAGCGLLFAHMMA
jgi:hypothetical protein